MNEKERIVIGGVWGKCYHRLDESRPGLVKTVCGIDDRNNYWLSVHKRTDMRPDLRNLRPCKRCYPEQEAER